MSIPAATERSATERCVFKGTIIFRQGDPGDDMFVVAAGRVRLTLGLEGDVKEVGVFGKGEFFGELSLLSGAARTATAEAIEDTTLLVIDRDAFAMLVQDDLDIVFRMMSTQSRRLSLANQPIQEFGRRLGRIRIIAHCLRHLTDPDLPWTFEIAELASALQTSPEVVSATVRELVASGAGVLGYGMWRIETREQLDQLVQALCRYSEDRAP